MSVFRCQMRDFLVDLFTDARSYSSMLQMRFSRKAWLVHHSLHHCCGQRWLRTKANSSLQCLTCPAVPLYHPTIMSPTFYQIFFHHFFSKLLSVKFPKPRVVGVKGGLEVVTGQTYTAGGIILFYSYEHWQNILYSCGERPIVVGQLVGIEYQGYEVVSYVLGAGAIERELQ